MRVPASGRPAEYLLQLRPTFSSIVDANALNIKPTVMSSCACARKGQYIALPRYRHIEFLRDLLRLGRIPGFIVAEYMCLGDADVGHRVIRFI